MSYVRKMKMWMKIKLIKSKQMNVLENKFQQTHVTISYNRFK